MASEHHVPRPQKIKLPPIPPSQLPQNIAPTKLSRGVQLGSFAFATGLTLYAVLVYDFGPKEHCFMPIRRWFDDQTRGLFTLTTKDRQILSPAESKVAVPDRRTPIEFFKENGVRTGGEKDGNSV
ncbi:hypothetical protein BCR35DRAFT_303615 [Leucosporidium creatinivorum]|uniref:Uncharacterized protein n=1 Tax=Leucosporidium creatinivorum TaxID=106004 RepID=A0A1Y2FG95_9BASI|nr:hypothetical protein BCR35DRAFT_303615 [Leucosporidium creatinivorum]